jgi:hypothetical protein
MLAVEAAVSELRLPSREDPLIHPAACDLVDAQQEHRLARLPAGGAMLDEIGVLQASRLESRSVGRQSGCAVRFFTGTLPGVTDV